MEKIEIELGVHSLKGDLLGKKGHHINRIRQLQALFKEKYDVDLDVITYNGIISPYGGGRTNTSRYSDMTRLIEDLNKERLRFNLALNGGMTFEKHDESEIDEEREKFDHLNQSGKKNGIRNSVTITAPVLYDVIRKEFENLEIYASCIQFLDPFNNESYKNKLQKYDKVIPLNQHTTHEYLKNFADYADKMMIFLNHHCGRYDLINCYNHVTLEEIRSSTSQNAGTKTAEESEYVAIRNQLPDNCMNCSSGMLTSRPEDLEGLIGMGIRSFKVPRDVKLKKEHVELLGKYLSK